MSRPKEAIEYDSNLLLADLAAKTGKWSSFDTQSKSLGISISYDKYKRARLGIATIDTLSKIAKVLNYSVERYLISHPSGPTDAIDLTGRWIALYLEAPQGSECVRTWESLLVNQRGNSISGFYDFIKTDDHGSPGRTSVYSMKGRVFSDNVSGFYWVGHRRSAHGIGTFQLKVRPDNIVCEGYCSFYGHDGFIGASHNFWIRNDGSLDSKYELRAAERAILEHSIYFEVPSR